MSDSIKLNHLSAASTVSLITARIKSSAGKKSDKTARKSNEQFDPYRNAYDDEDTDS